MAWYSLIFMNIPETFVLLALPFALLGVSIRGNLKSMIVFSLTQGMLVFLLSVYLHSSVKPFLSLLSFLFLVFFLFRFRFLKALIITLTGFVFLVLFEVVNSLVIVHLLNISFDDIFNNSWLRILVSILAVQIPMLLTMLIILRFKLKIRLPAFLK